MAHPPTNVKKLVLPQCKVSLCVPGGTGESCRDDPILSGNTIFWQCDLPIHCESCVCFMWRPYSASSDRKKDDALRTQMASFNGAFKKYSSGSGECERVAKPQMTLKLNSVSLGLSELPGRARGSMTQAEDGATPASLESEPLLPLVHLQLSKIVCVLQQKDKADLPAFSRDNTVFHSAGLPGQQRKYYCLSTSL